MLAAEIIEHFKYCREVEQQSIGVCSVVTTFTQGICDSSDSYQVQQTSPQTSASWRSEGLNTLVCTFNMTGFSVERRNTPEDTLAALSPENSTFLFQANHQGS